MLLNDRSTLKVFKSGKYSYIYIYFKFKGDIIRINTKNRYIKSYMTNEFLYNTGMKDYKELNKKTLALKKRVDMYIREKFSTHNPKINQKECLDYINGKIRFGFFYSQRFEKKEKSVLEHYEDFYNFKVKQLNNRPSVKDYKSLQNALIEYADHNNTLLTFPRINTLDFMADFRYWLSTPHNNKKNPDNKVITKGDLNDNTIDKRFSCLKTFYSWCEINKIYVFDKAVTSFKTPKYENDIFALTKEDIKQLQQIKTDKTNWQQILDLFIFNCFVGLRYSDLINLKGNNFITDNDGDIYIENENKKTGITVQIPLQKTPLNILKKYNFKLPKYSSQYFNREIKNIFEHYDLFNETVIKKKRQLKEKKDYPILRRKLISSHTCRRTFITLGIEANIPINSLMLASGHTKLQTIKKYMKLNQNKKAFQKIDLD